MVIVQYPQLSLAVTYIEGMSGLLELRGGVRNNGNPCTTMYGERNEKQMTELKQGHVGSYSNTQSLLRRTRPLDLRHCQWGLRATIDG